MNYLYLITLISCLFCSTSVYSQCIEQDLSGTGAGSSGDAFGQTFTACGTGLIETISVKMWGDWSATTTRLEFYSFATDCGNLLWTVDNVSVPDGVDQIIEVDMSAGSGISRSVVGGQQYQFLVFVSGVNRHLINGSNPYSNGQLIAGLSCSKVLTSLDLWFSVSIGTPLPVELITFWGKTTNDETQANLYWETASEFNSSHFIVQHATGSNNFYDIGEVRANGTAHELQNYQFVHLDPSVGVNYYRLRMVDFDGTEELSSVVSIITNKSDFSLRIFPNPTSNELQLSLSGKEEVERIRVLDMNGRIMTQLSLQFSNQKIRLHGLPAGLYFLEVYDGRRLWRKHFVKV